MAIYTVHSKAASPDAILQRGADVVFVREGFSWPAFALTAIWLIFKRMWIVLAVIVAYELVLQTVEELLELGPLALMPAGVAVNLILGLEAANLHRWTLGLRGYREIGVEAGDFLEEAEYRFFASLPAPTPSPLPVMHHVPKPLPHDADTLGLFSPPGNV